MKLLGKTDIEDALQRLDKLTHEESQMATAEILKVAHIIDTKATRIDENVKVVIARRQKFLQLRAKLNLNIYLLRWRGNTSGGKGGKRNNTGHGR
jgi:hypothetical protein